VTPPPLLLTRTAFQAAIDAATRDLSPAERVAVTERVATTLARKARRTRYPTPGVLAHKVDPLTTKETPLLVAIDRAVVEAVEAMERGESVRLGVFGPPQEGKSRRTTMATVLWLLVRHPEWRIGIASYEQEVAATFSTPIRNWIVEYGSGTALNPRPLSDDLLGITLRGDSTSKTRFDLAGHTGSLLALGMKGGWSGKPLDVLVIDDPYKDRAHADSKPHRAAVEDWFRNVAIPRLPSASLVILVQTRWHPDDLAGYVLREEAALPPEQRRWRFVNVPAQAERPPLTEDGGPPVDWLPDTLARRPGSYLISARGRTPEDWAVRRAEVGEMVWGSLYQQHPTPPEGALFSYAHITRNRRPAAFVTARSRTAVAVDTSAGGPDEAGILGGYRGTDGRIYITDDRSGVMTEVQWARTAWLLALDTQADDLVWEQNLAGPTMRRSLEAAWRRIVAQVRTLESLTAPQPDPFTGRLIGPSWERKPLDLTDAATRAEVLRRAAHLWAAEEQRLPITEVKPSADDERELAEILLRIEAGQFDGILDSPPARLIAVTATTGKKTRATPVATAYETNRVSHVGTLPEYEQELTHWEEGAPSPGRLDAGVWLVTHLSAARRARTTTSAGTTLPGTTPR
jgi:hypothetical protein